MSLQNRPFLWYVLGTCCYLAGLLLFLATFLSVYVAPPENSLSNFAPAHGIGMAGSVALLILGKAIVWKFGTLPLGRSRLLDRVLDRGPDESRLQALGYNVPPEESHEDERGYGYESGTVYLQCPDCGMRNDPEYTYCGNCSSELPDT